MKLKDVCFLDGKLWQDSILKSRDITLLKKVYIVKALVFPVVMYWRKSWTIRKAERQRTDAFKLWSRRRLLESLVLQGDQTSQSLRKLTLNIGRNDDATEAPMHCPPAARSQHIEKDPDAGKEWRQKEERTAEDDLVRQHHRLNEHEFEQIPREVKDREAWHAAVHEVAESDPT